MRQISLAQLKPKDNEVATVIGLSDKTLPVLMEKTLYSGFIIKTNFELYLFAGEAGKELLFPCVQDLKSKLHTSNDRERISFLQDLFEQKQFQDATKVR